MKSKVCVSGISIPAPKAWILRPTNNIGKLIPNIHINEPIIKKHVALKNKERNVKRSIKKAVIGIIIPLTSIKIVVSHCAVLLDIAKSFIISGSIVVINVWFSTPTKAPIITTAITRFRCFKSILKPYSFPKFWHPAFKWNLLSLILYGMRSVCQFNDSRVWYYVSNKMNI